ALRVATDEDRPGERWLADTPSHRAAPRPPTIDLEHLADLGEQITRQRTVLDRLEDRLDAADGPETVYHEAGAIARSAVRTGRPGRACRGTPPARSAAGPTWSGCASRASPPGPSWPGSITPPVSRCSPRPGSAASRPAPPGPTATSAPPGVTTRSCCACAAPS